MKQTAVEWLAETLRFASKELYAEMYEHIEQAKEIEKEQIEDAHIEGQRVFDEYPHTQWTNDQAEAYYKKTYNKK
jgi:hypothetical protein